MNIPDRWIADLQLLNGHVRMELNSVADRPEVGAILVTESYGAWETLEVLRRAGPHVGSALVVRLIELKPLRS